jgi:hypothetical protein
MTIMISYAREDMAAVLALAADLENAHMDVWVDRELTGGQDWWKTILAQIRSCELFIVALSPDSVRSRACSSELDYAVRLGRPLLPVMLREVAVQLAPQVIADTQIVDYRTRSVDAAIALISAVAGRPAPPPHPTPQPTPPMAPISYMNAFGEAVDASALSFKDQLHLLAELRIYLDDPADHDATEELLRRLRRRHDIAESVGREIDQLLDSPVGRGAGSHTGRKPRSSGGSPTPGPKPTPRTSPKPATSRAPAAAPGGNDTAELARPIRWIHLFSAVLVLLMVIAAGTLQFPVGPIVFFGAALAGLGLATVAIARTKRRPERAALRRGAFIWAGVWVLFFIAVAILYRVNLSS